MRRRSGYRDRAAFAALGLLDLALTGLFGWISWTVVQEFFLEQWRSGQFQLSGTFRALNIPFEGNTAYLLPLAYLAIAIIWLWLSQKLLRATLQPWSVVSAQRGWWAAKLSLELILIGWVAAYHVLDIDTGPALSIPSGLIQVIAIIGGTVTIWHYLLIKSAGKGVVVRDRGFYRFVAHPMYLGELMISAAVALLAGEVVALILFALVITSLLILIPAEEAELRGHGAHLSPASDR
ncbi:MAG: methyltransferase [Xanthomonadales bacterium]|nr:methyltransferase [Xanthomonadales bacterium]